MRIKYKQILINIFKIKYNNEYGKIFRLFSLISLEGEYKMEKKRLNQKFLGEMNDYDFSRIKEKFVFLAGSNSRARDYFLKVESILQILYDKLICICSIDGLIHKEDFSMQEWDKLQEIALQKLKSQEAMLVLDIEGYIGSHTREEIEYFKQELRRPIYYLSKLRKIEK